MARLQRQLSFTPIGKATMYKLRKMAHNYVELCYKEGKISSLTRGLYHNALAKKLYSPHTIFDSLTGYYH